jgi:hypothetical protein
MIALTTIAVVAAIVGISCTIACGVDVYVEHLKRWSSVPSSNRHRSMSHHRERREREVRAQTSAAGTGAVR